MYAIDWRKSLDGWVQWLLPEMGWQWSWLDSHGNTHSAQLRASHNTLRSLGTDDCWSTSKPTDRVIQSTKSAELHRSSCQYFQHLEELHILCGGTRTAAADAIVWDIQVPESGGGQPTSAKISIPPQFGEPGVRGWDRNLIHEPTHFCVCSEQLFVAWDTHGQRSPGDSSPSRLTLF